MIFSFCRSRLVKMFLAPVPFKQVLKATSIVAGPCGIVLCMLLSVVTFLVVLSILVLVHEFGHFILARWLKIGVEEFAIGLPITGSLWSRVLKDGLRISIYPALFGGFVKLSGEEFDEGETDGGQKTGRSGSQFWSKPAWVRLAVIVAGVVANALLAVFAFSLVVFFSGIPVKTNQVKILAVVSGSPAQLAGIKEGDVVVGAEEAPTAGTGKSLVVGKAITSADEFIAFVNSLSGKNLEIELRRGGDTVRVNAVPRVSPPEGEGALGVAISDVDLQFPLFPVRVMKSLLLGLEETWTWVKLTFSGVGYLVSQLAGGKVPSDIAGPVGIAQMSGQVAKEGILAVIQFLGLLSINLAVLNILPIPGLDGGHVLFIILGSLFGRRVAPKIEHWIHTVGIVVLLILMFLVTIRDIQRTF